MARADRAAAQLEAAREMLHRELRPLLLQAGLHETRLEWDEALALLQTVAGKAPQWYEARLKLGSLLDTLARYADAEPHNRAAVHLARTPNEEATVINNLAQLLQATNRLEEAEPLMRRALKIDEASFGPEHPVVARDLNNLAGLLQATNRLEAAEPLMRRALEIDEVSFGREHPRVAVQLNNLAQLLQDTNRLDEAEPLSAQHLEIFLLFTMRTSHAHPHLHAAFENYRGLLALMGRDEEAQQAAFEALMEAVKMRQ